MRTPLSKLVPLTLSVLLAVLVVAADAEAGGKKQKDRKKPKPAPATAPATADPAATPSGLAAPPAAVEQAQRHLLAYETDAAVRALEGAPKDDPWVAEARGWVLQQQSDFTAAASESRRAADLDPRNPAPLLRLGESLTYGEKGGAADAYAEAEKRARALLGADPKDVTALVFLGVAQQRLKRFDDSAATLEKARELRPGDPLVRLHLGTTRFYQQRWQQAFDELTAAVEASPGIALAYYYRGLAAGRLDRKDLLYNDLDRFVRMAPRAPEAAHARQLLASFG